MSHIFISHGSADDAFVAELRRALEELGILVWVDSRALRGGSRLKPEIEAAIEEARQFIAVLSPAMVNSPWVRLEIAHALKVEQRRRAEGYRVVPVMLPGITEGALGNWFPEEPLGVKVEVGAGDVAAALPKVLAALGERLPVDSEAPAQPPVWPLAELVLELQDPAVETAEGRRRARATAVLTFQPATLGTDPSRATGSSSPPPSGRSRPRSCAGTWRPTTAGLTSGRSSEPRASPASCRSGVKRSMPRRSEVNRRVRR